MLAAPDVGDTASTGSLSVCTHFNSRLQDPQCYFVCDPETEVESFLLLPSVLPTFLLSLQALRRSSAWFGDRVSPASVQHHANANAASILSANPSAVPSLQAAPRACSSQRRWRPSRASR